MKSTITSSANGKEYRWKDSGTDGLRSYSYNTSNSNWNYAKQNGMNSSGDYYLFTDSSTGKPSARRGNLYNMTAATLGSSLNTARSKQTSDSICPRGWQLPVGNSTDTSTNRSFAGLLNAYSITSTVDGANHLREYPLEYLPTGEYNFNGYANNQRVQGFWWANTISSNPYYPNGDALIASSTSTSNSSSYRGFGYARRC